ncbi:MAG TPA: hypothetical protein DEF00_00725 [Candidatus Taylorbacteria bacterium]|nr:MAG: hypothetical protein UY29_C0021G0013 [Parcubacteria group bacterium GW2011_GWC2_48_17]HBV00904.1 hypothetical protein [Candidatus Taylorbacteria bacterium]
MRVEPRAVGSYVHALKRGARGLPITKDTSEQWRFVRLLFYMNDVYSNDDWERETNGIGMFGRPDSWPERNPLVKILAWTLMQNHFHLLLKEIKDRGISKFMQKLGNSMSTYANLKHKEKGSLFQGAYKSRTVMEDRYLRYLAPYIMVKNVFELYPGGYKRAVAEFDRAWQWALTYSYSSLADYVNNRESPITDNDILGEIFSSPREFRTCARDMVLSRRFEDESFASLAMDNIPSI